MLKSFLFWGNGDWAQGNHLSCARKSSGASADWAQSRKSFAWTTSVLRPFRTFSAKQRISSLLFMLKSNKNLEPVRCVPIRKHEENEIAESLRIQGSFPQTSFDLGCQGELTQQTQLSAFQNARFLIWAHPSVLFLFIAGTAAAAASVSYDTAHI